MFGAMERYQLYMGMIYAEALHHHADPSNILVIPFEHGGNFLCG